MVILATCALASAVLGLALPLALVQVYDRIVPNQSAGTATVLFSAVAAAIFADGLFRYLRAALTARRAAAVEHALTVDLAEGLLAAPPSERAGLDPSILLDAVTGPARAREAASGQAELSWLDGTIGVGLLSLVWFIGGPVVAGPVVVVAFAWLCAAAVAGPLRRSSDWLTRWSAEEAYGGAEARRIALGGRVAETQRTEAFHALLADLAQLGGLLTTIAIVGLGAELALDGRLTTGGLAACTLLGARGASSLIAFGAGRARRTAALSAYRRLRARIGATTNSAEDAPEAWPPRAAVVLSGAAGDMSPYGADRIDVPPRPGLLPGTLLDNITGGAPERDEAARALATALGLDAFVSSLPRGYRTPIDTAASAALPAGVLKRIGLVRALAARPRRLLLDRPEAGLDRDGIDRLAQVLAESDHAADLALDTEEPVLLALAERRSTRA